MEASGVGVCCCQCTFVNKSNPNGGCCQKCGHDTQSFVCCIQLFDRAELKDPLFSQSYFDSARRNARERVWKELDKVALSDSRFDRDFSSFIPDFEGSSSAIRHLCGTEAYRSAGLLFISPDNCLEQLRLQALTDRKPFLTTTYGIRRGFWLLEPDKFNTSDFRIAALLDGIETFGSPITLKEIRDCRLYIDLAVTGTGGIDRHGVRFGKGHGFFDLEWAMLYMVRAVDTKNSQPAGREATRVFGVTHDCQVVDEEFPRAFCDTRCVATATPTGLRESRSSLHGYHASNIDDQSRCGIVWDKLPSSVVDAIPALQDLWRMTTASL